MSEVEKRVLVAIEGADKTEVYEALLLALHRTIGTGNFSDLLAGRTSELPMSWTARMQH